MKNYPKAIRWADKFASLFPEAPENKWMSYIASSSLSAIDKQEQAIARFRKLSGDNTAIGKVAASRLVSQEWRNKNPELFLD